MTTLNQIPQVLLVVVALFLSRFPASADSNIVTRIEKSLSPNRSLALYVISGGTNSVENLVLMSPGSKDTLAELALPKAVSGFGRSSAATSIAWKHDSAGVAVSFSDKTTSHIFGCVTTAGGRFKWIDLDVVEGPNLGVLGKSRADFVKVEHTPTRWTDASEHGTPRMVWVRSRFWDKRGQRYTVEQEFSISQAGEIGWK